MPCACSVRGGQGGFDALKLELQIVVRCRCQEPDPGILSRGQQELQIVVRCRCWDQTQVFFQEGSKGLITEPLSCLCLNCVILVFIVML